MRARKQRLATSPAQAGLAKGEAPGTRSSGRPELILCLLCAQVVAYTGQSLFTQLSFDERVPGGMPYDSNAAVLLSELLKLVIALVSLICSGDLKLVALGATDPTSLLWRSLAYAAPAVLYVVHNNLIYVAHIYLSAPAYQLLNNMKIITTGAVFRLVLGKRLRVIQWVAVVQLMAAMACTPLVLVDSSARPSTELASGPSGSANFAKGFTIMVAIACTSSAAGVYNERLLKASGRPVQADSTWLYLYGVGTAALGYCWSRNPERSFFDGFSTWTWCAVFTNGVLGLVISFIFKYGDNIVKLFGAAVGVLVTAVMSMLVFGFRPNIGLPIACVLVLSSTFLYYGDKELLFTCDTLAVDAGCPRRMTC